MKYPIEQYNILMEVVKQLSVHIEVKELNPNAVHFMVYQQLNVHQNHASLYCTEEGLKVYYKLTEEEVKTARKFIELNSNFELYPSGCNDNHIETAVKKIIKELNK